MGGALPAFRALQLLPGPSDDPRDPCDAGWNNQPRLDDRGVADQVRQQHRFRTLPP